MVAHTRLILPTILSAARSLFHSQKWIRSSKMDGDNSPLKGRKRGSLRLCNVSSYTTELLELIAENPSFHIVFIPGNPGVIQFYKDFLEVVYHMFEGRASVTAIGHIAQTTKDWERGKLFSLQDQIDHKVAVIKQELPHPETPLVLVAHSIGTHMSLEVLRELGQQVKYCIGLYPFLSLNKESSKQTVIGKIAASQIISVMLSFTVAFLGLFPRWATMFLTRSTVGKSWSTNAIEALCVYLLKYHTMRNILFLAMTEFKKFAEMPDWMFIRQTQEKIAFLFGTDDHWGPLSLADEISKQAPDLALVIETEGHTHAFSCTDTGSVWVADHVVKLIKHQITIEGWKGQIPA